MADSYCPKVWKLSRESSSMLDSPSTEPQIQEVDLTHEML